MRFTRTHLVTALVVGVGVAGYFVLRALQGFNKGTPYEGAGVLGTLGNIFNRASGGGLAQAGSALGGTAADVVEWWSGPSGGDNVFYTPRFPDGQRHAIGASSVDSSGFFTYNGERYRLGVDADGMRVAVRV